MAAGSRASCVLFASAVAILGAAGCGEEESSPPWPTDYDAVFSKIINDPTNDLEPAPGGSPPYPVDYPPADVTRVSLGFHGDYLYMRIDCVGATPTARVFVPETPPVEAQFVGEHNTGIYLDVDNSDSTGFGGAGLDVRIGVRFDYGRQDVVSILYDFEPGTERSREFAGELGEGGPGSNYVILRYDIPAFVRKAGRAWLPKGAEAELRCWSEAMSFDSTGAEFHHHFAFDPVAPTTWTLPDWDSDLLPPGPLQSAAIDRP